MTILLLVAAFLIAPLALLAASYLAVPLLGHSARFSSYALGILASVTTVGSMYIRSGERIARRAVRRTVLDLKADGSQSGKGSTSPIWDSVIVPLVWFLFFFYLAVADFYLTAISFVPLFGANADVPSSFHLPLFRRQVTPNLPLLMGLLWTAVAGAFGLALYQTLVQHPRRPFNLLSQRITRLLRVIAVAGLIALAVASLLFFIWRQGEIQASPNVPQQFGEPPQSHVNPVGGLRWAIVGVIGGLLPVAVALSAWSLEAVVGLCVLAALLIIWAATAVAYAVAFGAAQTLAGLARVVDELLRLPLAVARQILDAFGRAAGGAARPMRRERRRRRDESASAPPAPPVSPPSPNPPPEGPQPERTRPRRPLSGFGWGILMLAYAALAFVSMIVSAATTAIQRVWSDVGRLLGWIARSIEMLTRWLGGGISAFLGALAQAVAVLWRAVRNAIVWLADSADRMVTWTGRVIERLIVWCGTCAEGILRWVARSIEGIVTWPVRRRRAASPQSASR
jgi:hypothetical protein